MKKTLFSIIALLFGLAISFAGAELVSRKFGLSKTWESFIDRAKLMQQINTSKKFGYTRIPNTSFISARDVVFNINNMGFRDFDRTPSSNKKRIAFIGDSVTEGFGVDTSERYSNLVAFQLNTDNVAVEMLNFGISGHAPYDELEILKDYVIPFSPQVVLLQVCLGDFTQIKKMLARESQAANNNKLNDERKSNNDTIDSETEQETTSRKSIAEKRSLKTFLQANSAFYLSLAEWYSYLKLMRDIPSPLSPTKESIDEIQWNMMLSYLAEMDSICLANGAQFKVIYVPSEVEVIIKDADNGNLINNQLKARCDSASITFINTIDNLRSSNNKTGLYLDACHLSVEGNRIVSESIIDAIED